MFYLILAIISVSSNSIASAQEVTCNTCNCQFNNVEILTQLIESKIATARSNESCKLILMYRCIQCTLIIIMELGSGTSGVTYTQWGKSSCPTSTGAQLVYAGRTGGTKHNIRGGSAEKSLKILSIYC